MDKNLLIEQLNLNKSFYQIAKDFNKSPTTIRYWIKKYGLTKVKKESRTCPFCKEEKPITDFYNRRNGKGTSSYCKSCTNMQTVLRQRNLKQQCIEYKGGSCISCGYNKYPGALDFHHLDPSEKDFNLGDVKHYSFTDKIKQELDKCILLCSNCHREIHGDYLKYDTELNKIIENKPEQFEYKRNKTFVEDLNLNEVKNQLEKGVSLENLSESLGISKKYLNIILNKNNIYLNKIEEQKMNTRPAKIIWPSKEELEKLLWEKSTVKIAEELGVSDNAVAKYCKKLGLTKPPRGYWAKVYNGKV